MGVLNRRISGMKGGCFPIKEGWEGQGQVVRDRLLYLGGVYFFSPIRNSLQTSPSGTRDRSTPKTEGGGG